MQNKISILNRLLASVIIIANLYLIPLSLKVILTNGGPMGLGFMAIPFLLPIHIAFFFSVLTFRKKSKSNNNYLLSNSLAFLYILGFCFLYFFK